MRQKCENYLESDCMIAQRPSLKLVDLSIYGHGQSLTQLRLSKLRFSLPTIRNVYAGSKNIAYCQRSLSYCKATYTRECGTTFGSNIGAIVALTASNRRSLRRAASATFGPQRPANPCEIMSTATSNVSSYFLNKPNLKMLYNGLAEPLIYCCSFVWAKSTKTTYLEIIQTKAVHIVQI